MAKLTKAKHKKLAEFADGQPIDGLAVSRYREATSLPVDETLRMAVSPDPKAQKAGRLRAAALMAALEEDPDGDADA